ncbi:MAG: ROK family protein [Lentisphaerae bacterium]|jgi:predicted NBD/HSP70 family sugar kinase|nr:ROK family protein [Lentisphaerota bacterium]
MLSFLFKPGVALTREQLKLRRIIKAIYFHSGISRSDLCLLLGLNKNSMTSSVSRLLESGILLEVPALPESLRPGRRKIGLALRADLFYTLGAFFSAYDSSIVLLDAQQKIVEHLPICGDSLLSAEGFLLRIKEKMAQVIGLVDGEKVLGVGAALPGVLDFTSGQVFSSQMFPQFEFNLKDFFRKHFALPSIQNNISHIYALAEKHFGAAADMDHFLTIDEGLGMGIFCNGELYRGWQGCAGELGYMKLYDSQETGPDGRSGLLYDKAIFGRIGEKISEVRKNGTHLAIQEPRAGDHHISPDEVVKAVEGGSMFLAQLLSEVYSSIGDAAVNVAYLLNPQAIFLPAWTARCPQCTLDVVKMKMGSYGLANWRLKTEVRPATTRPEHFPQTAALMFAEEFFAENDG